ncbi:MAG: hypothetical protein WBI78_00605 [Methanosarcina flavescens]
MKPLRHNSLRKGSTETIEPVYHAVMPVLIKLFKKSLCLSPSVAPLDHADHAVLVKAWFVIKLFLKKFAIKPFLKRFSLKPFLKRLVIKLFS